MKKRFLSVLTALFLLAAAMPVPAMAAEAGEPAATLYTLGLFQGVGVSGDGTPEFALDRTPTRSEAVVMLVRLLGKETAAKAEAWSTPFSDVDSWAVPYVGYAYANGLTSGTGQNTFGGSANISAVQYITLVLRALGYSDGTDFVWNSSWQLSDELGLTNGEYAGAGAFDREDVAAISLNALGVAKKDTETTLLSSLLQDGAVTQAQITAAGLEADLTPADQTGQTGQTDQPLTAQQIYAKCAPAVFSITTYDMNGTECSQGSGFFIAADGTAVTNYHVIEDAFSAQIETMDGKTYSNITVLAYDWGQDVALLKVSGGTGFPVLTAGDSSALAGGQTVYAIGSPYGLKSTISAGIISNPCREDLYDMIQISVPISPGSSGGALIDEYGNVIGITTASLVDGQSLNFAVPISAALAESRGSGTSFREVARQSDIYDYEHVADPFSDNWWEIEPNDTSEEACFVENGMSIWGQVDDQYCDDVLLRCNTTGTINIFLLSDSSSYLVNDLILCLSSADGDTLAYGDHVTFDDGTVGIALQYRVNAPGVFELSILSESLYQVLSTYSADYAFYYLFEPDGAN